MSDLLRVKRIFICSFIHSFDCLLLFGKWNALKGVSSWMVKYMCTCLFSKPLSVFLVYFYVIWRFKCFRKRLAWMLFVSLLWLFMAPNVCLHILIADWSSKKAFQFSFVFIFYAICISRNAVILIIELSLSVKYKKYYDMQIAKKKV